MLLFYKKANQRGEKAGDATSRRLLSSIAVPLYAFLLAVGFVIGMNGPD
jgi:hypothetical protein